MQLSASPRGTEPRRAPEFAEKAAASEHLGNLKESQGSAHVSGPRAVGEGVLWAQPEARTASHSDLPPQSRGEVLFRGCPSHSCQ